MDFFVRHKTISAFVGFFLFCIISLSIQSTTVVFAFEGIGSGIVTPFQKLYDGIQNGIGRLWAGFSELTEVREELKKTREKLEQYEARAGEVYEIKKDNERLRKILELAESAEKDSVAASIISKDPDNWFRTLIINKGSKDGIKQNMPVVAYRGGEKAVVGKIAEVRGGVSRVIPVISPKLKLGVKVQETGYPGILNGYSSNSDLCIMDYVSRDAQVKPGDIVVTSGQAGIFPQGVIVGTVVKAHLLETTSYQRVTVKPVIDYNLIEEVFVIKKEPDKELVELLGDDE